MRLNLQITTEQEDYAKGFEDALKTLHNNESHQKPVSQSNLLGNTMSGGGITYADVEDTNLLMQIKEEPQQIQMSSPQMSPIDMESQEKIKLERKRQRNRVAASKCRKRKLGMFVYWQSSKCYSLNFPFTERISKLEDRVKILKVENHELGSVLLNLKQHVFDLKKQVISHHNSGCQITIKN